MRFEVLEPGAHRGADIRGRLCCTPKAMWKLNWFLRDFGYDAELLGREDLDDRALPGLRGVVKISHAPVNGRAYLNLDGFAPADDWSRLQLQQAS
jgi:hypothetical protein